MGASRCVQAALGALMRPAPQTFPTKTSAEQWLTRTEADLLDGGWIDPDAGLIPFSEYAAAWIEERDLRPSTAQVYRYVLGRHLLPAFGGRTVAEVKEPAVRRWRKKLLDSGVSTVSAAKAYRLLKAIMNTAVDDGLIRRNPCRIKGAAQDRSPERSVLTPVRYSPWPTQLILATGHSSCLRYSRASDGAKWRRCVAQISTWRHALSGLRDHSTSCRAAATVSGRLRHRPGAASSRFPPHSLRS